MQTITPSTQSAKQPSDALRLYSKFLVFFILFLIFVGGMVTSTESGLSVPDWPLSYGSLFPPMVGGVFYEHGHRMVASAVGLCTLILAIWLGIREQRRWVKVLGFCALGAVICQGILGGLTVIFMLPTAISVSHAVLAQSFFVLSIFIAYSLSQEREARLRNPYRVDPKLFKTAVVLGILIYLQLIIGALMRHTQSGLAILDFPTVAGKIIPTFDNQMLIAINSWRFDIDMDPVTMGQIVIHFIHRVMALMIFTVVCILNIIGLRYKLLPAVIKTNIILIDLFILIQIVLGILTILTLKAPVLTSFHVATGAASLGLAALLVIRCASPTLKK